MSKKRSRFESVEYDVLQVALGLLEKAVAGAQDLPQPGDNIAENLLYLMTFSPKLLFKNPMAVFKARAEAGDFNPLYEDEDLYDLQPGRQPMTDEEFAEAKAAVIEASQIWSARPEASLWELWQNAWQLARIEVCRAENEALWSEEKAAEADDDQYYRDVQLAAGKTDEVGEGPAEFVPEEPDGVGPSEEDEETYI